MAKQTRRRQTGDLTPARNLARGVVGPGVTPQMILNLQHLLRGRGPYIQPSGVESTGGDYRRTHQPNLLPVPDMHRSEGPAPSGRDVIGAMLRSPATETPTQVYDAPVERWKLAHGVGPRFGPGEPRTQMLADRWVRQQANRQYADRLLEAERFAEKDPLAGLAASPGPYYGGASESSPALDVLSTAAQSGMSMPMIAAAAKAAADEEIRERSAARTSKGHRQSEKDRTAPRQFMLRVKRTGLPPAQLAYTDALSRGQEPAEHILDQVINPQYSARRGESRAQEAMAAAQQTIADADLARTTPGFLEKEIKKEIARGASAVWAEDVLSRAGKDVGMGPLAIDNLLDRVLGDESETPQETTGVPAGLRPMITSAHLDEARSIHPDDEEAQIAYLATNFGYPEAEIRAMLDELSKRKAKQQSEKWGKFMKYQHPLSRIISGAASYPGNLLRAITGND